MIQCLARHPCLAALQRTCRATAPAFTKEPRYCHWNVSIKYYTSSVDKEPSQHQQARTSRRYNVFKKVPYPLLVNHRDLRPWTSLLERALPSHLQQAPRSDINIDLDAKDIAEVLLAAQRLKQPKNGFDLLYHLGVEQGRWTAVVWIVKHLVEAFAAPDQSHRDLSETLCTLTSDELLVDITDDAVDVKLLQRATEGPPSDQKQHWSLDELTASRQSDVHAYQKFLRRAALGQIWRSLGDMTISCAGGDIKPEILEIIAYLHHMEVMPLSIYNQRPAADAMAIQQPPMLSLFSSHILTSLSDAAWRAHERLIVEEAKAKLGNDAFTNSSMPRTQYRFNVAGLKPELWLELILWSCLHGGWIAEGAAILNVIYWEPRRQQWKPLSWRSLLPAYPSDSREWDKLEYLFHGGKLDSSESATAISVERTVSSEVVNAYVDGLLSTVRYRPNDEADLPPSDILRHLTTFRQFLERSELSLGAGSWDAMIVRFFEAYDNVIHQKMFDTLIDLSPNMGEGLKADNVKDLPHYILDGNAAVLGLFHNALRSRITAGDLQGAMRVFYSLQRFADNNKTRSFSDFFEKLSKSPHASETELFTSNFKGIEYPAFDVQIPPTILGPFIELIIDAKAFDLGRWLLYSEEVDGPVIPERLYTDPALTPALIRFASETADRHLLARLVESRGKLGPEEPHIHREVLQSFLGSQINMKRWDAAIRILQYMKDVHHSYWNIVNLAHVTRVMLLLHRDTLAGNESAKQDLSRAKHLFSEMVGGAYERDDERPGFMHERIAILMIVLSRAEPSWAHFCSELLRLRNWYSFALGTKAFNLVLDGIVEAYGSVTGKAVLDAFWRDRTRGLYRIQGLPNAREREVVMIPGHAKEKIAMYGGVVPDLMTINIILRKALEESSQGSHLWDEDEEAELESSTSYLPFGTDVQLAAKPTHPTSVPIVWAIRCLRSMLVDEDDIRDEISNTLSKQDMDDVRALLSSCFERADRVQKR